MSAFAVVQAPRHLERLCREFSALSRFRAERRSDGCIDLLLGVWIEGDLGSRCDLLATPACFEVVDALPLAVTREVAGIWALCDTESPDVTREVLLEALVAASPCESPSVGGRFLPVFLECPSVESDKEWRRLARRHRSRVLRPLYQRTDGSLDLADIAWAERVLSRDRLRASCQRISDSGHEG